MHNVNGDRLNTATKEKVKPFLFCNVIIHESENVSDV